MGGVRIVVIRGSSQSWAYNLAVEVKSSLSQYDDNGDCSFSPKLLSSLVNGDTRDVLRELENHLEGSHKLVRMEDSVRFSDEYGHIPAWEPIIVCLWDPNIAVLEEIDLIATRRGFVKHESYKIVDITVKGDGPSNRRSGSKAQQHEDFNRKMVI